MRITVHSNAPHLGAGYATQCAELAPRFVRLGHEVAVSAFCGVTGTRLDWNGIPVYPGGMNPYGNDVIAGHAADWRADLVLTLMDVAVLDPGIMKDLQAAHWMPVDCEPLSALDRTMLNRSGASVIAMSEFGRTQLENAGFAPYYVPHGIDTAVFAPGDQVAAREQMGVPQDAFVLGINAANSDDLDRKAWWPQLAAFALFRQRHKDVLLLAHSVAPGPGQNLSAMCEFLGITDAVRWSDKYKMATGGYSKHDMVLWYQATDAVTGAAKGEGFGLPLVEAQACGKPVIATNASAMREVTGAGWLVDGEPEWHPHHCAQWTRPHVSELVEAYEAAYDGGAHADGISELARSHALKYDADRLLPEWDRVLKLLEAERA